MLQAMMLNSLPKLQALEKNLIVFISDLFQQSYDFLTQLLIFFICIIITI